MPWRWWYNFKVTDRTIKNSQLKCVFCLHCKSRRVSHFKTNCFISLLFARCFCFLLLISFSVFPFSSIKYVFIHFKSITHLPYFACESSTRVNRLRQRPRLNDVQVVFIPMPAQLQSILLRKLNIMSCNKSAIRFDLNFLFFCTYFMKSSPIFQLNLWKLIFIWIWVFILFLSASVLFDVHLFDILFLL